MLHQGHQQGLQYLHWEWKSERYKGLELLLTWRLESDHYLWQYLFMKLKLWYSKQEMKFQCRYCWWNDGGGMDGCLGDDSWSQQKGQHHGN